MKMKWCCRREIISSVFGLHLLFGFDNFLFHLFSFLFRFIFNLFSKNIDLKLTEKNYFCAKLLLLNMIRNLNNFELKLNFKIIFIGHNLFQSIFLVKILCFLYLSWPFQMMELPFPFHSIIAPTGKIISRNKHSELKIQTFQSK